MTLATSLDSLLADRLSDKCRPTLGVALARLRRQREAQHAAPTHRLDAVGERAFREAIANAQPATGANAVFFDEEIARGQAPFDEEPLWRRRRAARRVRRATGRRIHVPCRPCLEPRRTCLPGQRSRGSERPRGARSRTTRAGPSSDDPGGDGEHHHVVLAGAA